MKYFISLALSCVSLSIVAQPIKTRSTILNYLEQKIKKGEPLVAHVLVPLCDNEHQGIVPTSATIRKWNGSRS